MLYFAYGMNTNAQEMAQRCPGAVAFGRAQLLGHRFRFARHADVQVDRNSWVEGVLWDITEQCLDRLDQLEGYPYYYGRKLAAVECQGQRHQALVYFMQPGHRSQPPSIPYFDTVSQGYQEFGVPVQQLLQSVTKSTKFQTNVFG